MADPQPTPETQPKRERRTIKSINVALQGGAAHGAFTWGVLDRLMRDGRIFISGISGTSSGAMNGVVFADGFLKGKRQGAIDGLEQFWRRISRAGGVFQLPGAPFAQFVPEPFRKAVDDWRALTFSMASRMLSPYQTNPTNQNPLRDILAETIDFASLRRRRDIMLYVTATNVRWSKARIFRTPEITVDTLLASACLPTLFQAVEIDGDFYWDGGYLGNPAIYPLIHECGSNDVLLVQVNPIYRKDVPRTAADILDRINEISFNSCVMREMAGMATITKLMEAGALSSEAYQRVHFHLIEANNELGALSSLSKFDTDWGFLRSLYQLGVEKADAFLAQHFDSLGKKSTLDVIGMFREPEVQFDDCRPFP
jgi:NTE family protein